jgi:hypothetical protein
MIILELTGSIQPSLSMPFFSIGYPDKERLVVTLLGSPTNPKSEGYDWARALVEVEAGAFKGEIEIYICVSDMIRFRDELKPVYKNVAGVAEFKTIEDQLFIKIEVDKLGHVLASGYIVDDFIHGNRLDFNIQYDQTLLRHTISEIDEALLELFPS